MEASVSSLTTIPILIYGDNMEFDGVIHLIFAWIFNCFQSLFAFICSYFELISLAWCLLFVWFSYLFILVFGIMLSSKGSISLFTPQRHVLLYYMAITRCTLFPEAALLSSIGFGRSGGF